MQNDFQEVGIGLDFSIGKNLAARFLQFIKINVYEYFGYHAQSIVSSVLAKKAWAGHSMSNANTDATQDKVISKNECTQIAQDFCSFSRRKNRRIAGYATVFTTQKMGKKTSELGIFFAGNRLIITLLPA